MKNMRLLQHLNQNQGAYTVLLTFALVVITFAYVGLTHRLTQVTARMHAAQTEAQVYVSIVPSRAYGGSIALEIRNIGAGTAHSVEQAAVYLGRTKEALQHLITSGKLPVVRADRRVFLDVRDLDEWVERNKTTGA